MAKFYVGKGLEEYLSMLQNLSAKTDEIVGHAVFEGAAIVADAIQQAIEDLPARDSRTGQSYGVYEDQRQGLKDGFGIAKMQDDNGYYNVKLGFDGYNKHVTKKYPNGQPNAMIARAINSGTSFSQKIPFVDQTTNRCKSEAEEAMRLSVESDIESIAKED